MKSPLTALLFAVALVSVPIAVEAQSPYPIVFPIDGATSYGPNFGDPRGGGRTHEGVDMMAEKMTPVVAAASGTVGWMHNEQGGYCCAMELEHDDGFSSVYIHLNNDTPGTDDGQGWGFAPGIAPGVHVQAGQLIGYVGDSGNAEAAPPHLHFELRYPSGEAFDPYPSLLAAEAAGPLNPDEFFFYRLSDGVFKYYGLSGDGGLLGPVAEGVYSKGWDSITAVDLEGDGVDEQFFYRSSDGIFKYYGLTSSGSLLGPVAEGVYSVGWDSIGRVDLEGDGEDEFFFYRSSDGVFKYYGVGDDGSLVGPVREGVYSKGWSSITAIDLDGDGRDEQLFYRSSDGLFKYYGLTSGGLLVGPVREGVYSKGWDSITAVDIDGDGVDEQFFYRSTDGTFKYYGLESDGTLVGPVNEGTYSIGWSSISALNFD